MKSIKITNGKVTLKEFCSYGVKTSIQAEMYKDAEVDPFNQTVKNLKFNSIMSAKTKAAILLIEEIKINGEVKDVSEKSLNEMRSADAQKVVDFAWELYEETTEDLPNG